MGKAEPSSAPGSSPDLSVDIDEELGKGDDPDSLGTDTSSPRGSPHGVSATPGRASAPGVTAAGALGSRSRRTGTATSSSPGKKGADSASHQSEDMGSGPAESGEDEDADGGEDTNAEDDADVGPQKREKPVPRNRRKGRPGGRIVAAQKQKVVKNRRGWPKGKLRGIRRGQGPTHIESDDSEDEKLEEDSVLKSDSEAEDKQSEDPDASVILPAFSCWKTVHCSIFDCPASSSSAHWTYFALILRPLAELSR